MKLRIVFLSVIAVAMTSLGAKAATFGIANITPASSGQFIGINLNQAGIDYLNAYGGSAFVFGGSYDGAGFVFGNTPDSAESNGKNVVLTVTGTSGNTEIQAGNIGWFSQGDVSLTNNSNYAAGASQSFGDLRNFFVFADILQDVGSVLAATLTIYNPTDGNNGTGTYSVHDYARMGEGTTPFLLRGTQSGTYEALLGTATAVPVPGAGIGLGSALMMTMLWFSGRRRLTADPQVCQGPPGEGGTPTRPRIFAPCAKPGDA